MTTKEIYEIAEAIDRLDAEKESILFDNGGEETEQIHDCDAQIADLMEDLYRAGATDALSELIIKSEERADGYRERKRDLDAAIKREEAYAERKKALLRFLMDHDGSEAMPRGVYQIKIAQKVKTETYKEILEYKFRDMVDKALANVLPGDVTVELKASSKKAEELYGELPEYFTREVSDTVKIVKPRRTTSK